MADPRHEASRYRCAECCGPIAAHDDLVTVNIDGHARAAHRNCPPIPAD